MYFIVFLANIPAAANEYVKEDIHPDVIPVINPSITSEHYQVRVGDWNTFRGKINYTPTNPLGDVFSFYKWIHRPQYRNVRAIAGNMPLHGFSHGTNHVTGETAWQYSHGPFFLFPAYYTHERYIDTRAQGNIPQTRRSTIAAPGTFSIWISAHQETRVIE